MALEVPEARMTMKDHLGGVFRPPCRATQLEFITWAVGFGGSPDHGRLFGSYCDLNLVRACTSRKASCEKDEVGTVLRFGPSCLDPGLATSLIENPGKNSSRSLAVWALRGAGPSCSKPRFPTQCFRLWPFDQQEFSPAGKGGVRKELSDEDPKP